MNNTLEKQRLFDQYSGQKVVQGLFTPYEAFTQFMDEHYQSKDNYLLLTSLSDITDEDAIWVVNRAGGRLSGNTYIKSVIYGNGVLEIISTNTHYQVQDYTYSTSTNWIAVEIADYLRSKSYVLPFNGKSVEEMIELGYMKLRKS